MDQLINKTSSIKYGQIIENAIINVDELIYENNKRKNDSSRGIYNHKKILQLYYETLIPNLKNYLHVEFKNENDKSDGLEINQNEIINERTDNKLENILGEDEEGNEEEASYVMPEPYQIYDAKENSERSLASVMLNKNEEEANSFAVKRG